MVDDIKRQIFEHDQLFICTSTTVLPTPWIDVLQVKHIEIALHRTLWQWRNNR